MISERVRDLSSMHMDKSCPCRSEANTSGPSINRSEGGEEVQDTPMNDQEAEEEEEEDDEEEEMPRVRYHQA